MAMITYQAFVEANPNPIIDQSDETVQNAVYDWFKYRYLGFENTSKFLDILQRNVSINYPMYQQKLRIEPGVSQYDWLVSQYHERQLKSNGENTGSVSHTGTQTVTGSGNATDVRTGSQTNQHNADSTNVKTGNETNTQTGSNTAVKSGNETIAKGGADTHVKTGGHTQTDVTGLHTTTTSPHVATVTSEDGGDSAWSGDTNISAVNPMSKEYSEFISVDNTSDDKQYYKKAYQHMPEGGLNWETLSNQAQSGHREYHDTDHKVTQSYEYGDGITGDIQTTEGSSTNPDTHNIVYNNETDTTNYGSNDTHTYNDVTDKQESSVDSTHTYNNVTDKQEQSGTDTLTYNSVTDTHTNGSSSSTESNGTDTTNGTSNRTDREQMTGRSEDPATLLMRATNFIEHSSAFMWFKEQIDGCFYPGYYEDDDFNGTTEGSCNI